MIKPLLIGAVVAVLATTTHLIKAQTTVAAAITSNQTWNPLGSPYILNGNCKINNGVKVTVDPGTTIKATGNYTLTIDGELKMLGSSSSPIHSDSVSYEFTNKSVDYNQTAGTGSQIKYVQFRPFSITSSYLFKATKTDLLFDHCVFYKYQYPVYNVGSDTASILMRHSKCTGSLYGSYPVYGLYKGSYLELSDDTFLNHGYQYLAERNLITGNVFKSEKNVNSYSLYAMSHVKSATVECNYFRRPYYSIYATILAGTFEKFVITNNQFDSALYCIYMNTTGIDPDSVYMQNNNFIDNQTTIFLYGNAAATAKNWDITGNYWGTTDTNKIKNMIYDNHDNSYISFRSDISSNLSQPVSACWPDQAGGAHQGVKNTKAMRLELSPNPVSHQLTVRLNTSVSGIAQIQDMQGRLVHTELVNGAILNINVSSLAAGTYFISVSETNGNIYKSKFIVSE
jgi:hypothetical protein